MSNEELKRAIEVVNTTQRGSTDSKLIHYVVCEKCQNGFAKQSQDYNLALKNGYKHICRLCK
jgi:hypothetical protein